MGKNKSQIAVKTIKIIVLLFFDRYSTAMDWDIVSGPVADDRTASVIDLYLDGMYDEEETIKRLLPQKLKDQYTFKTEEALVLLNFRGVNLP